MKTEIIPGCGRDDREVCGAHKVWLVLNRQGTSVARCTTERLMRELGLLACAAGTRRTTLPGKDGQRAPYLLIWAEITAMASELLARYRQLDGPGQAYPPRGPGLTRGRPDS